MMDFIGKGAIVTGGASGIGLGIARCLARAGARVAIADASSHYLDEAVADARNEGLDLLPFLLDVTDRAAFARVADAVEAGIGPIGIVILSAGVGTLAPIGDAGYADWDWMLRINLDGTMNGVRTFVSRLRRHGQGGYIVATASLGGLGVASTGGIYSASKFPVVAAMQCLREELAGDGIGVSVLCPGPVATNIYRSHKSRTDGDGSSPYFPSEEEAEATREMLSKGLSPDLVGEIVLAGMHANQLHIITHNAAPLIAERRDALLASCTAHHPTRADRATQVQSTRKA